MGYLVLSGLVEPLPRIEKALNLVGISLKDSFLVNLSALEIDKFIDLYIEKYKSVRGEKPEALILMPGKAGDQKHVEGLAKKYGLKVYEYWFDMKYLILLRDPIYTIKAIDMINNSRDSDEYIINASERGRAIAFAVGVLTAVIASDGKKTYEAYRVVQAVDVARGASRG